MNKIKDKQNRQDHALAQLLVHAPRNNSRDEKLEVGMEELAMLTEGKLSEQRREEVIGQLDSNPLLYETWLASQEMAQQVECLNAEIASEHDVTVKSKFAALLDGIGHFLSDLFSWQGAFATSFGIALGVTLVSQNSFDNTNDQELGQGIAIHAPIESPQKSSIGRVGLKETTPEIVNIEVIRIEGNIVHLKVILITGEELIETYVYKPNKQ